MTYEREKKRFSLVINYAVKEEANIPADEAP